MSAPKVARLPKIGALTGLRGLAALLVPTHRMQFLFLPQNAVRVLPSVGYAG